ncbi:molybdate ABC transporter permease subunit [Bacillaceae bacterium W0354]
MMEWSWFPIQLSFYVSIIATVITLILGVSAAHLIVNKKFKGKSIIETIFYMPLVLPPTVVGFLLIIIFGRNSFVGQFIEWLTGQTLLFTATAAIIAAVVVSFPLMYQSVKTGYLSVDQRILDAARVDGASEMRVWLTMTMPLAYRSMIAGIILSFTRAFGEFGATLMFAGNIPGQTQTVPTAIYLAIETGNTKVASYYVIFSILFSFILLLFINRTKAD